MEADSSSYYPEIFPGGFEELMLWHGGSVGIAPGGESLFSCLEPRVFIDLLKHRTLSSGDGPLSMLIGCGLLPRLRQWFRGAVRNTFKIYRTTSW
ncbi:hypothetical protein DY000_02016267 [Brassica cretica]|uniref:Uncharacterized protein n=1 Tax=Brassica cretica TaxID=69181 RepID=A0ABQ7D2C4_BRACR|nr:hypothetical protein DY000_02016267 [Brassica cretica]